MLETELKCIIDEDTFNKVKDFYKWDWVKEQVNHYYGDESGELGKSRTTVRVRVKDGINYLQIKAHKNQGSPLQICEETEFIMDNVPDSICAEDAYKYTGIKTGRLIKLGSLSTIRHSLMLDGHTEICLDKNSYLDAEDFEIEVEYIGKISDALLNELKNLGISFENASVGKYTRFASRLNDILQNK